MTPKNVKSKFSAQTRTAILDATEQIMRNEGYAAVSSRRVAEVAGMKSQLVYYHFGTMDELFLALYERVEEQYLNDLAKALAARNPLRALWKLNLENVGTPTAIEYMALANHRKVIQKELSRAAGRYYSLQREVLARFLQERGVSQEELPPGVLSFLLGAISRALATEIAIGVNYEHEQVLQYVERWLGQLERITPSDPSGA